MFLFSYARGFPVLSIRRALLARSTSTMAPAKEITLPTGAKMPTVGLGTWKIPKERTTTLVQEALTKGYRALDCACDYGNEAEVGAAIDDAITTGMLQRSELFITSKLWNTYHRREHVRPALERTLSDLRVDYLDLYLIHFPISLKYVPFEKRYPPEWVHDPDTENTLVLDNDAPLAETWRALEELVDKGLIRAIGVCNFPVILLMELLKTARVRPAMLQVELHPYLTQQRLLDFCSRNNIAVTAFSPLGAPSYVQLEMDAGLGKGALAEPAVVDIAKRIQRTPAQVLLRWGIQRGTAVIPKTSKSERLAENAALWDFELSDEDIERISALDRGLRFNNPGVFCAGMGFSIPIYD